MQFFCKKLVYKKLFQTMQKFRIILSPDGQNMNVNESVINMNVCGPDAEVRIMEKSGKSLFSFVLKPQIMYL